MDTNMLMTPKVCGPSIDYTPVHSTQKAVFQFFCPICSRYFKWVFETSCCRNHICEECARCIFETKQNKSVKSKKYKNKSCPFCAVESVRIRRVMKRKETTRSYIDDTPSAARRLEVPSSPMRVGMSFEEMREKVVPYEKEGYISHGRASVVPFDESIDTPRASSAPCCSRHEAMKMKNRPASAMSILSTKSHHRAPLPPLAPPRRQVEEVRVKKKRPLWKRWGFCCRVC